MAAEVTSAEDGAGWPAFLRGLVARGLTGVQLVISDAHAGLVEVIGSTLPGAGWQRCRTHYLRNLRNLRNLLTRVPKSAQPWVATLVRTIFDQPAAEEVHAQHARVVASLEAKHLRRPSTWTPLATTCWPSPASRASCGGRSGRITPRSG